MWFGRSNRDIQEVLHQRGIEVRCATLREWCMRFSLLSAEDLGAPSGVPVASDIGYRAMEQHTFILHVLLPWPQDTEAVKTFLARLAGRDDVPDGIHTDLLRRYGAAIWEISSLINVNHQQVISTAKWSNTFEQEH